MVENIYKTFNQKAQCAHTLKNKNIIHSFKAKTSLYEVKALALIEQELYIHNTLLFIKKLTNFQDSRTREVFKKLNKKIEAQNGNKKCKNYFKNQSLKIKKMVEMNKQKKQLESFKILKQHCFGQKELPLCSQNKKTNMGNKINENKNVCKMDLNKNIFSSLDISEIEMNYGRQIILSTSCNQLTSMDSTYKLDKQMCGLKHQIKEKEQYLRSLQKEFQRKSQHKQHKNRKIAENITSQSDMSDVYKQKRNEKRKESQYQLIGILIKKNFQLEEKLDEVYQLLAAIQPDMGTEFGTILSKLRRKKCFHISFENQNSSL